MRKLVCFIAALPLVAACGPATTLEIENDTGSEVFVAVDTFETVVATGETAIIDLDVPLLNKKADVDFFAIGDYYIEAGELTVTVGEGNPKYLDTNAGVIELENIGTSTVSSTFVERTSVIGDNWTVGIGDWGPSRGPIGPGEVIRVGGLVPASDYAIMWDNRLYLNEFNVDTGADTIVTVTND